MRTSAASREPARPPREREQLALVLGMDLRDDRHARIVELLRHWRAHQRAPKLDVQDLVGPEELSRREPRPATICSASG